MKGFAQGIFIFIQASSQKKRKAVRGNKMILDLAWMRNVKMCNSQMLVLWETVLLQLKNE